MRALLPIDAHYTPARLAEQVLEYCTLEAGRLTVADFSAGNGSLLDCAQVRFGAECLVVAVDSDRAAVRRLRQAHPDWAVHSADVYRDDLWSILPIGTRMVDLLLLNPPFSYRGGGGIHVSRGEVTGRFSPAVAFLLLSLPHLRPGGQCLAILPANALSSERDAPATSFIRSKWGLRALNSLPPGSFPGVRAKTVVVEIGGGTEIEEGSKSEPRLQSPHLEDLALVRGNVPMHTVAKTTRGSVSVKFLHTSGMRSGNVSTLNVRPLRQTARQLLGPFVAVPRVGTLSWEKLSIYPRKQFVALSDCVFGLKPSSSSAASLLEAVQDNFSELSECYQGSCAQYLTVARLSAFLTGLGYNPVAQGGQSL